MEAEYQRNLSHSYLILKEKSGGGTDSYEMRVLAANRMEGLLSVSEEQVDDESRCSYDVTALLPFTAWCGMKKFRKEHFRKLYAGLLDLLEQMEDYLLEAEHLVLLPEYLYVSRDTGHIEVPYFPLWRQDLKTAMTELTEYLIRRIGHGDGDSVVLACRFLHGLTEPDFRIRSLRRILEENTESRPLYGAEDEEEGGDAAEEQFFFGEPLFRDGQKLRFGEGERPDPELWNEEDPDDYSPGKSGGEEALRSVDNPNGFSWRMNSAGHLSSERESGKCRGGNKRVKNTGSGRTDAGKMRRLMPDRATVITALLLIPAAGAMYVGFCLQKLVLLSPDERLAVGGALIIGTFGLIAVSVFARRRSRRRKSRNAGDADIQAEIGENPVPAASGERRKRGGPGKRGGRREWEKAVESEFRADAGEAAKEAVDFHASFAGDPAGEGRPAAGDGQEENMRLQAEYTLPLAGLVCGKTGEHWELRPEADRSLETIPLEGREMLVGRKGGPADQVISDETVSRIHARLFLKEGVWYVSDLNSRNGTSVDGKKTVGKEEIPLSDGTRVAFARCRYVMASTAV